MGTLPGSLFHLYRSIRNKSLRMRAGSDFELLQRIVLCLARYNFEYKLEFESDVLQRGLVIGFGSSNVNSVFLAALENAFDDIHLPSH